MEVRATCSLGQLAAMRAVRIRIVGLCPVVGGGVVQLYCCGGWGCGAGVMLWPDALKVLHSSSARAAEDGAQSAFDARSVVQEAAAAL